MCLRELLMSGPRAAAALLLVLLALPALARIEYVTTANGKRVTGSEVCFYRSNVFDDASADLAVTAVRCYSADLHLDVPAGAFTVLARNVAQGLVAQTPAFIALHEPTAEERYQSASIPMVPAAFLDATDVLRTLGPGEHLVLLFGATKRTRPYLHPLTAEETTVMVPPETPFVAIRVKQGSAIAVSDVAKVAERSRAKLPAFPRDVNFLLTTAQVIQPEGVSPPDPNCRLLFSNPFVELMNAIEKPGVVFVNGKTELRPLFPVEEAGQLNVAPLLFRGVPAGEGELRIRGDRWVAVTRPVDVPAGQRVVTVTRPLRTEPAAMVTVRWDVPGDLRPLRASCAEISSAQESRELLLLRCAAVSAAKDPATIPDDACEVIGRRALPAERNGVETFAGVARGTYLARLRYGALPMAQSIVTAPLGETVETTVSAQPLGMYGRVTRAGAPVAATVTFSSGTGVSDAATGEYYALLGKAPGRRTVRVKACDDSFVHTVIPDGDLQPNTRFDIEVPTNDVTVHILGDAGAVGAGVIASLSVSDPRQPGTSAYSLRAETNAEGKSTIGPVMPGSEVMVCASVADYVSTCTDLVKIREEHTSVDLRLKRPAGTGRAPAGYERIFWVMPDGRTTEDTAIHPETGSFSYKTPHAPPEHVVLVSRTLPLLVLPQPALKEGESLSFVSPSVPSRAFTIVATPESAQESAMVAIEVGDRLVPVNAFLMHQNFRGAPFMVVRRAPVPVRDIAAIGPLSLVVGHDPFNPPPNLAPGADPFAIPAFRASYREVAISGETVSLPQ
ncbi:MAG TPA: hypothetical protein VF266_07920 [Thermoanaerobaculia bacterium]